MNMFYDESKCVKLSKVMMIYENEEAKCFHQDEIQDEINIMMMMMMIDHHNYPNEDKRMLKIIRTRRRFEARNSQHVTLSQYLILLIYFYISQVLLKQTEQYSFDINSTKSNNNNILPYKLLEVNLTRGQHTNDINNIINSNNKIVRKSEENHDYLNHLNRPEDSSSYQSGWSGFDSSPILAGVKQQQQQQQQQLQGAIGTSESNLSTVVSSRRDSEQPGQESYSIGILIKPTDYLEANHNHHIDHLNSNNQLESSSSSSSPFSSNHHHPFKTDYHQTVSALGELHPHNRSSGSDIQDEHESNRQTPEWQATDLSQVIHVSDEGQSKGSNDGITTSTDSNSNSNSNSNNSNSLGLNKNKKLLAENLRDRETKGDWNRSKSGHEFNEANEKHKSKDGNDWIKNLGHNKHGWRNIYHKEEYADHRKFHDVLLDKNWAKHRGLNGSNYDTNKGIQYDENKSGNYYDKDRHGTKFDFERGNSWRQNLDSSFKSDSLDNESRANELSRNDNDNEQDHDDDHELVDKHKTRGRERIDVEPMPMNYLASSNNNNYNKIRKQLPLAGPIWRQESSTNFGSSGQEATQVERPWNNEAVDNGQSEGDSSNDNEREMDDNDDEREIEQIKEKLERLSAARGSSGNNNNRDQLEFNNISPSIGNDWSGPRRQQVKLDDKLKSSLNGGSSVRNINEILKETRTPISREMNSIKAANQSLPSIERLRLSERPYEDDENDRTNYDTNKSNSNDNEDEESEDDEESERARDDARSKQVKFYTATSKSRSKSKYPKSKLHSNSRNQFKPKSSSSNSLTSSTTGTTNFFVPESESNFMNETNTTKQQQADRFQYNQIINSRRQKQANISNVIPITSSKSSLNGNGHNNNNIRASDSFSYNRNISSNNRIRPSKSSLQIENVIPASSSNFKSAVSSNQKRWPPRSLTSQTRLGGSNQLLLANNGLDYGGSEYLSAHYPMEGSHSMTHPLSITDQFAYHSSGSGFEHDQPTSSDPLIESPLSGTGNDQSEMLLLESASNGSPNYHQQTTTSFWPSTHYSPSSMSAALYHHHHPAPILNALNEHLKLAMSRRPRLFYSSPSPSVQFSRAAYNRMIASLLRVASLTNQPISYHQPGVAYAGPSTKGYSSSIGAASSFFPVAQASEPLGVYLDRAVSSIGGSLIEPNGGWHQPTRFLGPQVHHGSTSRWPTSPSYDVQFDYMQTAASSNQQPTTTHVGSKKKPPISFLSRREHKKANQSTSKDSLKQQQTNFNALRQTQASSYSYNNNNNNNLKQQATKITTGNNIKVSGNLIEKAKNMTSNILAFG